MPYQGVYNFVIIWNENQMELYYLVFASPVKLVMQLMVDALYY